jgi:hypothetical protein
MSKIIEAKAVISATDKTGNVFDKVAAKIKGVEKSAKSFEGIKAPKFVGDLNTELMRLKLSERELQNVRKSFGNLDAQLKQTPIRAAHYFRAMDDWKDKTVAHWREVKANAEAAEKAQQRFYRGGAGAARFAAHAIGIGGGAYAAGRALHAGAKQIGERGRELARYSLGGIEPQERAAAEAKADELSAKYPSVSRTEVLSHIRQLRARLGSFDHAMENVETLTKAQTMLGTLGKGGGEGAAEDLEKLTLALESQGLGSNPDKFRDYMDAFVKAKSLFPDLKGEDFRQYMQTSNSSKYGLSPDYLKTIAPTMMQHEGASNFGTMQASAFSALVGRRQTKAAKAVMKSYGLIGENGDVVDQKGFISNPREWAERNLRSRLEGKGVQTDEEHRGDMVEALTKMFSNRKVGEFFASMLVNKAVLDKDKVFLQKSKDTEGADIARKEDPYVALAGLTTQAKDLATAFIGTKQAIEVMNSAAEEFAKRTNAVKNGDWLSLLPQDDQDIVNAARRAARGASTKNAYDAEAPRLEAMQKELNELVQRESYGGNSAKDRMRKFDLEQGINSSDLGRSMPPVFTEAEIARGSGAFNRPAFHKEQGPGEMPAVQSLEGANVQATLTGSAEVKGEVTVTNIVQAGSELLRIVSEIRTMQASLYGQLKANGPGSTGKSSPDATAPSPRGNAGGASGSW